MTKKEIITAAVAAIIGISITFAWGQMQKGSDADMKRIAKEVFKEESQTDMGQPLKTSVATLTIELTKLSENVGHLSKAVEALSD